MTLVRIVIFRIVKTPVIIGPLQPMRVVKGDNMDRWFSCVRHRTLTEWTVLILSTTGLSVHMTHMNVDGALTQTHLVRTLIQNYNGRSLVLHLSQASGAESAETVGSPVLTRQFVVTWCRQDRKPVCWRQTSYTSITSDVNDKIRSK